MCPGTTSLSANTAPVLPVTDQNGYVSLWSKPRMLLPGTRTLNLGSHNHRIRGRRGPAKALPPPATQSLSSSGTCSQPARSTPTSVPGSDPSEGQTPHTANLAHRARTSSRSRSTGSIRKVSNSFGARSANSTSITPTCAFVRSGSIRGTRSCSARATAGSFVWASMASHGQSLGRRVPRRVPTRSPALRDVRRLQVCDQRRGTPTAQDWRNGLHDASAPSRPLAGVGGRAQRSSACVREP